MDLKQLKKKMMNEMGLRKLDMNAVAMASRHLAENEQYTGFTTATDANNKNIYVIGTTTRILIVSPKMFSEDARIVRLGAVVDVDYSGGFDKTYTIYLQNNAVVEIKNWKNKIQFERLTAYI